MPLHPVAARYRPLAWLLAIFLAVSTLTRLVLLVAAGSGVPARPGYWLDVLGIGFAYDLLAFVYFAWPLVLLLWLLPRRLFAARAGRWSVALLGWLLVAAVLFIAVAEWTFWEEFQTRFNFIAVDYLVYTTEVIGNIRESYPVPAILSVLFVVTSVAMTVIAPPPVMARAAPLTTSVAPCRLIETREASTCGAVLIGTTARPLSFAT